MDRVCCVGMGFRGEDTWRGWLEGVGDEARILEGGVAVFGIGESYGIVGCDVGMWIGYVIGDEVARRGWEVGVFTGLARGVWEVVLAVCELGDYVMGWLR
ncbi:autotransporter domain-containing protein [Sesbania bispinosa]|nr:autotransporter domain-containing protein [Sesbania bispinosa]